jgi:hypothetical protein
MISEIRFSDEFLDQVVIDVGQGKYTSLVIESTQE